MLTNFESLSPSSPKKMRLEFVDSTSEELPTAQVETFKSSSRASQPTSKSFLPVSIPNRVVAILPPRYYRPVTTTKVLAAKILDKTKLNLLLQAACKTLRLSDNLSHLKRVKSINVNDNGKPELHLIVSDVKSVEFDDAGHLVDYAQQLFSRSLELLKKDNPEIEPYLAFIGEPYFTDVSDRPPLTRHYYERARTLWPCTFHEDKRIASLIDGSFFSSMKLDIIRRYMRDAVLFSRRAALFYEVEDLTACLMVDNYDGRVVARAHDLTGLGSTQKKEPFDEDTKTTKILPYYHAPMIGIDLVAQSQGGGAYNLGVEEFPLLFIAPDNAAEKGEEKRQKTDNEEDGSSYLCTGYDVYLTTEPCLMCAMSLMHSRIRRLFYLRPISDGALGSKFFIHAMDSLNHHFEVFRLED